MKFLGRRRARHFFRRDRSNGNSNRERKIILQPEVATPLHRLEAPHFDPTLALSIACVAASSSSQLKEYSGCTKVLTDLTPHRLFWRARSFFASNHSYLFVDLDHISSPSGKFDVEPNPAISMSVSANNIEVSWVDEGDLTDNSEYDSDDLSEWSKRSNVSRRLVEENRRNQIFSLNSINRRMEKFMQEKNANLKEEQHRDHAVYLSDFDKATRNVDENKVLSPSQEDSAALESALCGAALNAVGNMLQDCDPRTYKSKSKAKDDGTVATMSTSRDLDTTLDTTLDESLNSPPSPIVIDPMDDWNDFTAALTECTSPVMGNQDTEFVHIDTMNEDGEQQRTRVLVLPQVRSDIIDNAVKPDRIELEYQQRCPKTTVSPKAPRAPKRAPRAPKEPSPRKISALVTCRKGNTADIEENEDAFAMLEMEENDRDLQMLTRTESSTEEYNRGLQMVTRATSPPTYFEEVLPHSPARSYRAQEPLSPARSHRTQELRSPASSHRDDSSYETYEEGMLLSDPRNKLREAKPVQAIEVIYQPMFDDDRPVRAAEVKKPKKKTGTLSLFYR